MSLQQMLLSLFGDWLSAQLLWVRLLSSGLVVGLRRADLDIRFHRHQPLWLHSCTSHSDESSGRICHIERKQELLFRETDEAWLHAVFHLLYLWSLTPRTDRQMWREPDSARLFLCWMLNRARYRAPRYLVFWSIAISVIEFMQLLVCVMMPVWYFCSCAHFARQEELGWSWCNYCSFLLNTHTHAEKAMLQKYLKLYCSHLWKMSNGS